MIGKLRNFLYLKTDSDGRYSSHFKDSFHLLVGDFRNTQNLVSNIKASFFKAILLWLYIDHPVGLGSSKRVGIYFSPQPVYLKTACYFVNNQKHFFKTL